MNRPTSIILASLALLACAPGVSADTSDTQSDAVVAELSRSTITSAETFAEMSNEGGAFLKAGRSLKFLIDNRRASTPQMNFMNAGYRINGRTPDAAKYHYNFAREHLNIAEDSSTFNEVTYFSSAKRYFAGTIQSYRFEANAEPLYAIQFYPDDVIAEETLLIALKVAQATFKIPGAKLAFVATGPQQTFARIGPQLASLGIEAKTIDDVLGNIQYLPMQLGEAWGYLRMFPRDVSTLRPTDIPVFDELPLDLSVVAGVITRAYQDASSHISLKSKERGTPDMVLRSAGPDSPELARFTDKPVHLVIKADSYTIEATTPELVEQKLRERTNRPWVPLPVKDDGRLLAYDDMCPSLGAACFEVADAFGGKATGLGFLAGRQVLGRAARPGTLSNRYGYDLVPEGFGVPVQQYRDFVAFPANVELRGRIETFVAREKSGELSPSERRSLIEDIQSRFYSAPFPPGQIEAIRARVAELMPGEPKFKVRSSATSEDIPNFDGAGLYDSFAADPTATDRPDGACTVEREVAGGVVTKAKVKPKTFACAVKAVYGSLWNQRAVEERSYARLDHETAGMGLAIVPAYDNEGVVVANGVIVTRVLGGDGVYGYTLGLQKGNNAVTNPEPGTLAETTLAIFGNEERPPRFTTTRYATPFAGQPKVTAPLLPEAKLKELVEIAKTIEVAYCQSKPGYYRADCNYVWLDVEKPKSLDMEFKILDNGHIVLKQSREFHGR